MTGSFSSADQHAADPENYYDIRLHMVPIWRDRTDGPWLYVEQASAAKLDQPYRQRVYHLAAKSDGTLESAVWELPGDPLRFAGAWRTPERFNDLSPADLTMKAGCSMILRRRADGAFVGGTVGKGCESTLRGAAYATSEATITAEGLITWDRGYDADARQVWGATKGGYVFKRVEDGKALPSTNDAQRPPPSTRAAAADCLWSFDTRR
jgi:hypothetical protein